MLVTNTPREVSTHGITETRQFSIKANGKAFKVLIDGLYSDKIRAVIREIWTNAFDAHVMAGNADQPFDCHLPTIFEPVFRVRDYGVGMSHEQIMVLYTTVFESSKEDTNSQVGKLGLGSKSPFAYVDTFTVTSWDGTMKRSYSAFIGEDYIPRIASMGEEASDEPRGIEISFPVKSGDIHSFMEAAKKTALGFDVLPNFVGAPIRMAPLEVITSGTRWKLVSNGDYSLGAHAKQGCVVYPIDPNAVSGLSYNQQQLLRSGFFIEFPIGDLEITASREGLGYDAPTQKNIREAVEQIEREIVADYQKDIDAAPSMWKAAVMLKKLLRGGLNGAIQSVLRAQLTYRGKAIEENVSLNGILRDRFDLNFDGGGVRTTYFSSATMSKGRSYGRRASLKWDPTTHVTISVGETTILIEDSDSHVSLTSARIRHWYDSTNQNGAILWIKGKLKGTGIHRLLVALGKPDKVVKLADLPRPPVDKTKASRAKVSMKMFNEVRNRWDATTVDEEDEIVYVNMHRNEIVGPQQGETRSFTDIRQARDLLVSLGYLSKGTAIIGVPQTHANVPKRNPETWTCLWTLAAQAIDEHYDEALAGKAKAYNALWSSTGKLNRLFQDLVKTKTFTGFQVIDTAQALYKFWQSVQVEAEKLGGLNDAMNLFYIINREGPKPYAINNMGLPKAFLQQYPLVEAHLTDYAAPDATVTKHIVHYVNLIDTERLAAQSDIQDNAEAA
jgi:hypothetical protein